MPFEDTRDNSVNSVDFPRVSMHDPSATKSGGASHQMLPPNFEEPFQSPSNTRGSVSALNPTRAFHRAARALIQPDYKPDFKKMAELLCEGVSVNCQDNNGRSALHLVAETGSIDAARFLIGARCDVNLPDHNDDTALHLAAMHDEAAMVAILIEEGAKMEKLNKKGLNAMHEAIFDSYKTAGSVDSVKVMVGQGADLRANTRPSDSSKQPVNPSELAAEKANNYLVTYIDQRLHGVRDVDRTLMVRISDARYVIIFWALFLFVNELLVLLVMSPQATDVWCCVHYLLLLLTSVSHLGAWCIDPGYLKHRKGRKKYETDIEANVIANDRLLGRSPDPRDDGLRHCPTCLVNKPRRSKHCTICRLCVSRFDHHCPWVNNCVGENNHRVFVVFISSLMILMLYLAACCFVSFGYNLDTGGLPEANIPGLGISSGSHQVLSRKLISSVVHRWITLVIGLALMLMGVRVGWLWWEQVKRVALNLTTYEENSSWRFPYLSQPRGVANLVNDFDNGSCSNCATFWNCGSCTGVGNYGEDVVYYMYQLIQNVKKLRGDSDGGDIVN